ncbi:MAG: hypothetical protein KAJ91_01495 [Candidatus Aenigmarchaeota archaeon]|nr:hypothetical protein [Candidatus Aenigmarchaeota archaeon]
MNSTGNKYAHSVYYFTMSVYKGVGETDFRKLRATAPFKLIFKSVLLNSRYKQIIGTHITYTTRQIHDSVKSMNYDNFTTGFLQLGSDIAFPEDALDISGDKDVRLIRHAINKDGDIIGDVKIVVDDYETKKKLERIILEGAYPLRLVSSEEALDEMNELEKKLKEEYN